MKGSEYRATHPLFGSFRVYVYAEPEHHAMAARVTIAACLLSWTGRNG